MDEDLKTRKRKAETEPLTDSVLVKKQRQRKKKGKGKVQEKIPRPSMFEFASHLIKSRRLVLVLPGRYASRIVALPKGHPQRRAAFGHLQFPWQLGRPMQITSRLRNGSSSTQRAFHRDVNYKYSGISILIPHRIIEAIDLFGAPIVKIVDASPSTSLKRPAPADISNQPPIKKFKANLTVTVKTPIPVPQLENCTPADLEAAKPSIVIRSHPFVKRQSQANKSKPPTPLRIQHLRDVFRYHGTAVRAVADEILGHPVLPTKTTFSSRLPLLVRLCDPANPDLDSRELHHKVAVFKTNNTLAVYRLSHGERRSRISTQATAK